MDQRIVFYSTGCPKCKVLKQKLDKAGVVYVEEHDEDTMIAAGLKSAPALLVGNELLLFPEAIKWVNALKESKE